MSEIIKTEAVVLSKMNYRESSKIATFYTRDFGKISALVKGARSSKSSIGMKIDIFNHLQIVLYKKSNRELQLLTQAELIGHFPNIKTGLDKLKFGSGVLELTQQLTVEEVNRQLFKGLVKMLNLFDSSNEQPGSLLIKYILFLLKELGYEIQLDHCTSCGKSVPEGESLVFNLDRGIICRECAENSLHSGLFPKELFNLIIGLRTNKSSAVRDTKEIDKILSFLENYLKYHVHEFKGIRSIHLY